MNESGYRQNILVIDIVERMYERDNINIQTNSRSYLYEGEVQFIDPQYLNCKVSVISTDDCGEIHLYLLDD